MPMLKCVGMVTFVSISLQFPLYVVHVNAVYWISIKIYKAKCDANQFLFFSFSLHFSWSYCDFNAQNARHRSNEVKPQIKRIKKRLIISKCCYFWYVFSVRQAILVRYTIYKKTTSKRRRKKPARAHFRVARVPAMEIVL